MAFAREAMHLDRSPNQMRGTGLQVAGETLAVRLAVAFGHEQREGLAQGCVSAVAEHFFGSSVPKNDGAARVGRHDGVGCGLGHHLEACRTVGATHFGIVRVDHANVPPACGATMARAPQEKNSAISIFRVKVSKSLGPSH